MKKFQGHLRELYEFLRTQMSREYNRHVSFGDLMTDRWERAQYMGFGKGSSCYGNVLILGDVKVGEHTWIGPNTVLDGSGGLKIGSYCSISAGVQIYTHDSVEWSNSMGQAPKSREPTVIGNGVYIGPQAVIQKGISVGDRAVIGAMSLVNIDVPADAVVYGIPARSRRSNGKQS